ncbi:putative spermidine/putrescine transport system substrate-binding protein [Fodinibius salinus]|uniref:Putative spermidine/putrescine transport system substrate-binding protein n=1 Tax=Fodinibius salinus TaxID=860790 RepID=A0A5D3YJL4_9BACT|nr:ABC transporter substrate-binding protein [Fodinibius salinus]TYP93640.1 putative spermidine/putrescine transport system substrate-binding protein [Fodinibius salinus]
MKFFFYYVLIFSVLLFASCSSSPDNQTDLQNLSWDQILQKAEGQSLNMMMWQGDPNINKYMQQYVVPQVKKQFDIDLNVSNGQGSTIVSVLMSELEAGQQQSELDLVWINGETFYQLREIDALYGPFVSQLPNSKFIDFSNPFIKYDFQQSINGYEVPWGKVQFTIIYDSARVSSPPTNRQALRQYVKTHPGTFTIANDFSGMTFLKSLLIGMAGKGTLSGEFNEQAYQKYSERLWNYINDIKPYFWKNGETFPSNVTAMHQLFVNGELNFTMSNNDTEVDNKILEGFFPQTARAYVFQKGTIRNSHYVGIPKNSTHKAAAMVVSNFLISPEAQYRKARPDIWGDGTVLSKLKVPPKWQQKFAAMPQRYYAPPRDSLQDHALRELAPEYMIRLYEDFRTEIIQK